MAKLSKKACNCIFLTLIVLLIVCLLKSFLNKPVREGVVFTPYDNRKLFTKPWAEFCVPPPASCDKNPPEGPAMIGSPPIGCHCKGVGDAGSLDPDCDGNEPHYFFS